MRERGKNPTSVSSSSSSSSQIPARTTLLSGNRFNNKVHQFVRLWNAVLRATCLDTRSLVVFRVCLALVCIVDLIAKYPLLNTLYAREGPVPFALALYRLEASKWSLLFANPSSLSLVLLWIACFASALALMFGVWGSKALIVLWVLNVSFYARNVLIVDAGDQLLLLLLFWSMLLFYAHGIPTNVSGTREQGETMGDTEETAKNSNNSNITKTPKTYGESQSQSGVVAFCFYVQGVIWFVTSARRQSALWRQGTAWYTLLSLDLYTTRSGYFMLRFPRLMWLLSVSGFVLSWLVPLLLVVVVLEKALGGFGFSRFWNRQREKSKSKQTPNLGGVLSTNGLTLFQRALAASLFAYMFNMMLMSACSNRGIYLWVSVVSCLPWMPGKVWSVVERALSSPFASSIEIRVRRDSFVALLGGFFMWYFVLFKRGKLCYISSSAMDLKNTTSGRWFSVHGSDLIGSKSQLYGLEAVLYVCNQSLFAWPISILLGWPPLSHWTRALWEISSGVVCKGLCLLGRLEGMMVNPEYALSKVFASVVLESPFGGSGGRMKNVRKRERMGSRALSLSGLFALLCLGLVMLEARRAVYLGASRLSVRQLSEFLSLEQTVDLFPPVATMDGWFVVPGMLNNGRKVNVLEITSGEMLSHNARFTVEKPSMLSYRMGGQRMTNYMLALLSNSNEEMRRFYGQWVCRSWNIAGPGRNRDYALLNFELLFYTEETLPGYRVAAREQLVLWAHTC